MVELVDNPPGGAKISVHAGITKTLHGASFEGGHLLPQGAGSYVSQSRQGSENARGVHRIALSKQLGDGRIGRQCTTSPKNQGSSGKCKQSNENARGVHRIALSKQLGDSRIGRQCTGCRQNQGSADHNENTTWGFI